MPKYLNVPGAQLTTAEKVAIFTIAGQYDWPDRVMVNIGIMWGGTMWCLRDGAPRAALYGVDIAPDNWKIVEREALNAVIIQGDSRTLEFDEEIDVLLIDGDHHYDVVKADIENWLPRMRKGGVVIFHDYNPTQHNLNQFPELEGVKRAVGEFEAEHPEWVALPAPDSLRILRWQ